MVQQNAVIVRNAVKFYVPEKPILDGLNMTVPKGTIYGLLGASGCGKTTLLSCIVGVKHIDTGEIWVLGGKPGQQGSGIPGPRVGYMPQEIGLVGEFSMSGALYYFGRINGLEDEVIEARQKFLSELLQLPPANHLVKNMSGGQQRRVSFAAAMIHSPELLILDEPTVGLDPILSNNIWIYLTKITREEGTTVLITTHYIQEAKDSNVIGLMRSGKLLAESSPQELLERFQCSSLEEAFLGLCQAQNMLAGASQVVEPIKNTEDDACHQDEDSYKRMKKFYDDMSDATHDVRNGELVGVMYFHHNFSEALQRRIEDFVNARTEDIVSGKIDVFLDMGDMQIGQYMEKKLYERFFEIYEDVLKECKYPPKFGNIPIRHDIFSGFFISVACKDHTMANYASTGSFFPLIIISASIWPIEGMPDVLRYFSYCTPTTLPSAALRAVIFKGYALDKEEVFTGVLVSCAYISMLFIFVLIGLKLKS
ncbi:hypothetical protein ACFW04_000899 [Cataglyphis niger]